MFVRAAMIVHPPAAAWPRQAHRTGSDKFLPLLIYHSERSLAVSRGRSSRADSRYAGQAAQLARQLRQVRESAGITQERLAAQAGVAIATVRKIESGAVVEPGYFTVLALMDVLGTSPGELRA
jgi:DNA-binding XRE family transcriptional regulator